MYSLSSEFSLCYETILAINKYLSTVYNMLGVASEKEKDTFCTLSTGRHQLANKCDSKYKMCLLMKWIDHVSLTSHWIFLGLSFLNVTKLP